MSPKSTDAVSLDLDLLGGGGTEIQVGADDGGERSQLGASAGSDGFGLGDGISVVHAEEEDAEGISGAGSGICYSETVVFSIVGPDPIVRVDASEDVTADCGIDVGGLEASGTRNGRASGY